MFQKLTLIQSTFRPDKDQQLNLTYSYDPHQKRLHRGADINISWSMYFTTMNNYGLVEIIAGKFRFPSFI